MKLRIKYLWKFAKAYKWSFVNAFLCILLTSMISMAYPSLFAFLIDEVFYNRDAQVFLTIILIFGITYAAEQALHLILNIIWPYQFSEYLLNIRQTVYKKILLLKYEALSKMPVGDMIGKVNWESEAFVELLHRNIAYLFADSVKLATIIAIVWLMDFRLAVLMAVIVPVSYGISFALGKRVGKAKERAKKVYTDFLGWVFEMLAGVRDIKLMCAEKLVYRELRDRALEMNEINAVVTNRTVFSDRCNAAVQMVAKLLLYVIAAVLVVRGDITLGTFIAVIAYFETADTLLVGINKYWVNVHVNLTVIDSVIRMLEMEEETDAGLPETEFQTGRIWLKNVDFQYGERKVLDGFSLTIHNGEKIAIVGKSGAGKSTIANILLKLLEVKPGCVEIDGHDICDISIKSIRRQIGIVHQETAVFDGTVRENLLLVNSKAAESELWQALRYAGLEDYVKKLPEQLDTVLGADGLQMSGGEAQRLSVARIFLKNVKILIMDEATSALDAEMEYFVNRMCGELSAGKTVIMIAHRLSTVLSADKVAVIENGKLAGYGTAEDLYENNACYRTLFEEQYRFGKQTG